MQAQGPIYDVDAAAFFARVTAAGGSLTLTEKSAVNTLVIQMKADGTWTPMKAIYPMVGASAAACAQNLKSSSFTGTFSSGWTFASTGVTPNGTSAYMDTAFTPSANQSVNNFSLSVYVRTSTMAVSRCDMGSGDGPSALPLCNIETNATTRFVYAWDYQTAFKTTITTDASGMWGSSRSGASSWQSFERNTASAQTSTVTTSGVPNFSVYIGGMNFNNTLAAPSFRQVAFAHLGDSLSGTQFNNFYTAVQAFQTTLSRNV